MLACVGVWSPSALPGGWRVEQIPGLQGTLEIPQKRHSYCVNQQTHPWEVKGTLKFFCRFLLYFLAQTQGQPLALEVTSGPNHSPLLRKIFDLNLHPPRVSAHPSLSWEPVFKHLNL